MTLSEFRIKLILLGFNIIEYSTDIIYVYDFNEYTKVTLTFPKDNFRPVNVRYKINNYHINNTSHEENLESLLKNIITFIDFGYICL